VIDTPPVGGTHFLGATVNIPLVVSASTLASLSYDADGDTLTITAVGSTAQSGSGTSVALTGGGTTITYSPGTYVGADSFTYTISDGYTGGTATATADVTVSLGKATSVFNSLAVSGGVANLQGFGIPAHSYDVQKSDTATFSVYWTLTPTVTAAANGVILFTDSNATNSSAFYRFAVH
jgi:hypothetical protein